MVLNTAILVSSGVVLAGLLGWLSVVYYPPKDSALQIALHVEKLELTQDVNPAELERGRSYYIQICQDCHGALGDGQGEWRYRMIPKPANLLQERVQSRSDEELAEIVRVGVPGTAMRGWEASLNNYQRQQVVTFIRYLATAGQL